MSKRAPPPSPWESAEPGTLCFLVGPYREWQRVKGFAEATIVGTTWRLVRFVQFCEDRGALRPAEVSRQVVERFQRHLYHTKGRGGRPLGTKYQATMLIALRGFFKWLARERHLLYNPASEIELPKVPRTLPRTILTAQEAEQVFCAVDLTTPQGLRDRALLELLYSTAVRRMEVAKLLLYDVDLTSGTVFVREGKGGRDRVVPIGERAIFWMQKYLLDGRPRLLAGSGCASLFLNVDGTAMQYRYIGQVVPAYVRKSGLEKRGGCHMFRHTCATLMLEGGADVRYVQALLGHAQLNSTQIYTQVSIQKLKEVHRATHPAKMKAAASLVKENPESSPTMEEEEKPSSP